MLCFQSQGEKCSGCDGRILDRYLVKVSGRAWHTKCLKCCVCGVDLGREATCYTKEESIYCKADYARFVYNLDASCKTKPTHLLLVWFYLI